MAKNDTIVVCDAGPIIHLDELNSLSLLDYNQVLIPKTVELEIRNHRDISFQKYKNFQIVQDPVVSEEMKNSSKLYNLHKGEIMAISLVMKYNNCMLLTDDSAARLYANHVKLQVHGTIGILIRAVRRNLKSPEDIIQILKEIPTKSTMHIKKELLDYAIHMLK
ncbi:MAG: DNA-binding protein [Leptospiraceae bacterium]|nr:DNA-binding protein [Leptospiraceae bacterium]